MLKIANRLLIACIFTVLLTEITPASAQYKPPDQPPPRGSSVSSCGR